MIIKENGIVFNVFESPIKEALVCDGIGVPAGMETVTLGFGNDVVYFDIAHHTKIRYESVKKIVIPWNVKYIYIPNELFPNVREVESQSKYFDSGKYLVTEQENINYGNRTLINSFCLRQDEVLDMSNITAIGKYALSGCETTNAINTDGIDEIDAMSFRGSAIEAQKPEENGCVTFGNVLINIDDVAEELEIPKHIKVALPNLVVSYVERLILHKIGHMGMFVGSPETIVFADDVTDEDVSMLKNNAYSKVMRYEIMPENKWLEVKDDAVYTKITKRLVTCKTSKTEEFVVPEGIMQIDNGAFSECQISSVTLPDSLKYIGSYAFENCPNLKKINFGNGIEEIGKYGGFSNTSILHRCEKLTKIVMPKQVKRIGDGAFAASDIKSIQLNEGVEKIGTLAFMNSEIHEIKVPRTIKYIDVGAFSTIAHIIFESNELPAGAAASLINTIGYTDLVTVTIGGESGKSIIIPRPQVSDCLELIRFKDLQRFADEQTANIMAYILEHKDYEWFVTVIQTNDYDSHALENLIPLFSNKDVAFTAYLMDEIRKRKEEEKLAGKHNDRLDL